MPEHTQDEPAKEQEEPHTPPVSPEPGTKKRFDLKAFIKTKKGKITLAIASVLVVLGLVFAIPASRYAVAGLVIKKDVVVEVIDTKTGKAVSAVQLALGGQTARTDATGKATFKAVAAGPGHITAKKSYYQDGTVDVLVPILASPANVQVRMIATGRQVPVTVTNKINGQPVGGVEITVSDATATTTDDGQATLVLPADRPTVSATFTANGYNKLAADVTVTEQKDDKNNFGITPAGSIYFLSKRTGKIDVMRSDLDGANATVAVAGTGHEDEGNTVLLASRDWKYLALRAKRDSDDAKLYLISTADNKLSTIDEGANVSFTPVGWYNQTFVYTVYRPNVQPWEKKGSSIKSFNAQTSQIATIDDTDASGTDGTHWAHETFTNVYILEDGLVYGKFWNNYFSSPELIAGKKDTIISVKPDGSQKKTAKDFASTAQSYIETRAYKPDEVYIRVAGTPQKFYEYEDGNVTETTAVDGNTFYDANYPTYLLSPSGSKTFWYEQRDGKNVSFVGDKDGGNGQQVLADDAYQPYGWYSDDYLLFSKKGSELYILPRDNSKNVAPFKVTDYHKPNVGFPGYGYGYGGGY